MRSLDSLSYRHLTRRRARYGLVLGGVAIGVSVVFAVLVSSSADTAALNRAVQGTSGSADAVVGPLGAFDAGLPAGSLARVRAVPDVAVASPSFAFRTAVNPSQTELLHGATFNSFVEVSGRDPATDQDIHRYQLVAGRMWRPGADEVVVPAAFARRQHVGVGGTLPLVTPVGVRPVTVSGILSDQGAGLVSGGSVAYTSITAAQVLDGQPGAINGIEVKLTPGTSRSAWIPVARRDLGQSVEVINAADLAADFKSFMSAIDGAFFLASTIAVFVGAFLVFLTFSVSVAERTRVFGTLRALGAARRQVRRLVVMEAAAIGLAASVPGILVGYGLGAANLALTRHLLNLGGASLGLPFKAAVFSVVLAVTVSSLAAWLPARRAAALSPVAAMREGQPAAQRPARWWPAVALLVSGCVVAAARTPQVIGALAMLTILLGAVFLVPVILRPLARFFGSVTRRLAPGSGDIAVMHLVKERSRSSYTLALIMIVLAMTLALGASNQSMNRALDQVLDREAGSGLDMQVSAAGAFDPSVGRSLATMPGVHRVSPMEYGRAEIVRTTGTRTVNVPLQVVDPASFFDVSGYIWATGTDSIARQALTAGGSILLPDTTAQNLNLTVGRPVLLRTVAGVRPFTLAATYTSVGTGFGIVAGAHDLALLGAGRPNVFLVRVDSATAMVPVQQRILAELGPRYQPFITTAAGIRAQAHSQIRGFYSIGYVLLALAGIIGMMGLANTLVVSVLSRTREIGILRSSGLLRRQVRRMVLVEAEVMALVAMALSLPLAGLMAAAIITGQRQAMGFSVTFRYPWSLVLPVAVGCVAVAALASIIPARRASRLEPVAALRFD